MKKKTLFALALPIFIESLLYMCLGFIDVFALSQYDDVASSAVGTANQIVSICNLLFSVSAMASAVIITQNLGANNRKKATQTSALSLSFNFILGVIVSAVLLIFGKDMLVLLGARDKILSFAYEYLMIVGGFVFVQSILNTITSILRSHGYTELPMYVSFVMNVINTVLDLCFVFGWFGMPILGVKGVAIATTVSRIVGCVVLIIIFFRKIEKPSMFKMIFPFPWRDFATLMKIGVPSAFESFNYNLSQLVVTGIALQFLSTDEYIARTYVQNITSVFYIFSLSIGQASQILIGHKVGAGKLDEAYRGMWRYLLTGYGLTGIVCATGVLLRSQLMGIFTNNSQVIAIGSVLILINVVLEAGRCTNLIVINGLRGAGDIYFPTAAAIFSMWVISTIGAYLLAVVLGLGIYGMWIAFAADECFRGILMIFRWKSGKWRTKSLVKSNENEDQQAAAN